MTRFLSVAAMAMTLVSAPSLHAAETLPTSVVAAVADAARPDADRERDASRKPAEVVAFAGVKPGMIVAELGPGGGYFTRILAKAVGPSGKVYALLNQAAAARPGVLEAMNKLASDYPNIKVVTTDYTAITLPEKADLFWTTENYHDYHNGPTANIAGLNKSVFDNLKAGGTFYVEDHNAADGAGLEATSKVHRMDVAVAKTELAAAGFKLDGEGTALKNAADDRSARNSESGHFVTDRFMLRMKRP
jgi:predicted methyltransferase